MNTRGYNLAVGMGNKSHKEDRNDEHKRQKCIFRRLPPADFPGADDDFKERKETHTHAGECLCGKTSNGRIRIALDVVHSKKIDIGTPRAGGVGTGKKGAASQLRMLASTTLQTRNSPAAARNERRKCLEGRKRAQGEVQNISPVARRTLGEAGPYRRVRWEGATRPGRTPADQAKPGGRRASNHSRAQLLAIDGARKTHEDDLRAGLVLSGQTQRRRQEDRAEWGQPACAHPHFRLQQNKNVKVRPSAWTLRPAYTARSPAVPCRAAPRLHLFYKSTCEYDAWRRQARVRVEAGAMARAEGSVRVHCCPQAWRTARGRNVYTQMGGTGSALALAKSMSWTIHSISAEK
ncbi:hypothetical protein B0H14DRAFT_3585205 [Mycena olivaceomarginata]|nr:hypothetical protein B0H14DRAFT_3585205 [Mycena olivaceomarginata]